MTDHDRPDVERELNAAFMRGAFSGLEILQRELPDHPKVKFLVKLLASWDERHEQERA